MTTPSTLSHKLSSRTRQRWKVLRVNQYDFDKYKPTTLAEAARPPKKAAALL
jgi:hypothetical protein